MIIWLQGPSGAGKTTVGRELARLRRWRFIDIDEAIELRDGRTISAIFAGDGEGHFRALEREMILSVSAEPADAVIAPGAGALHDPRVRRAIMASGIRVFIDPEPEEALRRLAGDASRPMLAHGDRAASWKSLRADRLPLYRDADIIISGHGDAATVATEIDRRVELLERPEWSFSSVLSGEVSTVSWFHAPHILFRHLRSLAGGCRLCVIGDWNVLERFAAFAPDGSGDLILPIDPGEASKSLATVEGLAARMAEHGCTRDAIIVGIGGGVVTDLAGFLGSIYMRGVRTICIPTTLLAQVDASIGGKTAVNAAGVRNLIGTFKQPSDVLMCGAFLRSLPPRELRSGFVESLKMGIANSADLARAVEDAMPAILDGALPENLVDLVRLSVGTKLDVVERDTHDTSLRLSLNFGHTFGHALEAVAPGVYAHGEAVAFGLVAAALMALELGVAGDDRCRWIIDRSLRLTHDPGMEQDAAAIITAMDSDKKRVGADIRFVLPAGTTGVVIREIGDRELVMGIVRRALELVREHHRRGFRPFSNGGITGISIGTS
ncbi:MAG: bifunctional shikimate kinase (N-terminal) / dehydroquinate synthase (C-terminal) enzyme [Chlorobi bacterium]|nr:bifunctional shikimate kinase (N-terminal) / dehydroquinate synthase (C-terminal) enzyme [Chlorobiota bacterium]